MLPPSSACEVIILIISNESPAPFRNRGIVNLFFAIIVVAEYSLMRCNKRSTRKAKNGAAKEGEVSVRVHAVSIYCLG